MNGVGPSFSFRFSCTGFAQKLLQNLVYSIYPITVLDMFNK